MAALIPHFHEPVVHLGSLVLPTHGVALAGGAAITYLAAWWQCRRLHLPIGIVVDTAPWISLAAVLGGHVPAWVASSPSAVISIWDGQSLTSAIAFGGCSALISLRIALARTAGSGQVLWQYLNVWSLAAIAGGACARIGCLLTHERIGPSTTSWLGIQGIGLHGAAAHDMALYDVLASACLFSLLAIWTSTRSRNALVLPFALSLHAGLQLMH
ncbi:prolipoprotein diacylglyceryl transferase family protein [Piscinibacter terrae]|nr:prolipoprotein diacylglyceryl transferase family protein [Albitalea terrae]